MAGKKMKVVSLLGAALMAGGMAATMVVLSACIFAAFLKVFVDVHRTLSAPRTSFETRVLRCRHWWQLSEVVAAMDVALRDLQCREAVPSVEHGMLSVRLWSLTEDVARHGSRREDVWLAAQVLAQDLDAAVLHGSRERWSAGDEVSEAA